MTIGGDTYTNGLNEVPDRGGIKLAPGNNTHTHPSHVGEIITAGCIFRRRVCTVRAAKVESIRQVTEALSSGLGIAMAGRFLQ